LSNAHLLIIQYGDPYMKSDEMYYATVLVLRRYYQGHLISAGREEENHGSVRSKGDALLPQFMVWLHKAKKTLPITFTDVSYCSRRMLLGALAIASNQLPPVVISNAS
jgi:hypothetical protein